MSLLSTQDVAERLGITIGRVQQLIWEEKLPAQKVGRTYVVDEADLEKVRERKRGRPFSSPPAEPVKTTRTTKKANGKR